MLNLRGAINSSLVSWRLDGYICNLKTSGLWLLVRDMQLQLWHHVSRSNRLGTFLHCHSNTAELMVFVTSSSRNIRKNFLSYKGHSLLRVWMHIYPSAPLNMNFSKAFLKLLCFFIHGRSSSSCRRRHSFIINTRTLLRSEAALWAGIMGVRPGQIFFCVAKS